MPSLSRVRLAAFALALGLATLSACGGGGEKGGTAPTQQVSSVVLSADTATLRVGGTLSLSATGRDAAGATVPNRTIVWASTDPSVARVDPGTGLVTAVGPGIARITATIDGRQAGMTVTVIAPVAAVSVAAPTQTIGTGGSVQLSATLRDATGGIVTGRPVTWRSSDESIARVTADGLVTGVAPGTVRIDATSEGVTGSLTVVVVAAASPAITDVSPATLTPGATVTITGTSFSSNPSELTVTVGGLAATVLSASATSLSVRLSASYPCQATRPVDVEVRSLGGVARTTRTLQVARTRQLAVGQALFLSGAADIGCNELPPGGARYMVNVVNATPVVSSPASVQVRGIVGVTADGAPLMSAAPLAAPQPPAAGRAGAAGPAAFEGPRHAAEHVRRLDEDRRLVQRIGRPRSRGTRPATTTLSAAMSAAAAPVPLNVGDTTTLRFRSANSCATFSNIRARVVHVGTRSVVLEASDAPLATRMDADYQALGKEFDDVMYDVLVQNFGDPLAYDAQTDRNGRIVMLFTNAVNAMGASILGFVSACDFYPPTFDPQVAASNQAEIFYARVPTTETGSGTSSRTGWMRSMRSTLIHEGKHIVSFATRFANDADVLEEAWLEEGTAQVASELYGRRLYPPPGAPFRGNALYANTIYCEVRPTVPTCGGIPALAVEMFSFLDNYYRDPEGKSFFNSPQADVDIYGSAWAFARWAADHSPLAEPAFFRALTQERTQTGLANVSARMSMPVAEMQSNFMLALYADDFPGLAHPAGTRYSILTWHTRDIFAGLNRDFPTGFDLPFPLLVRSVGFGAFSTPLVSLIGGGAMYVEISGTQSASQLVSVTNGDTPITSGSVRVALLRVQ